MSMFESELENLLGEFHIKMKGEMRVTKHPANKWEIFFCLRFNPDNVQASVCLLDRGV